MWQFWVDRGGTFTDKSATIARSRLVPSGLKRIRSGSHSPIRQIAEPR